MGRERERERAMLSIPDQPTSNKGVDGEEGRIHSTTVLFVYFSRGGVENEPVSFIARILISLLQEVYENMRSWGRPTL